MVLFAELNAKIVHDEDEHNGAPFVSPEAQSSGHLEVSVGAKAVSEEVIGKFTGLFEAIDSFSDFELDPAIVGKGM